MAPFVDRIEGTTDSVIGMPLELTARLIREVLYGVE
jgi:predicted house-cleaning NTP pyrophosphatase (Maf/HAM1 superfamily)